jgi:NAD(P)-dependent dehydrogenase (short-subunit alcohol dehydrogenase family)
VPRADVAVVTGASRGIGRLLALHLARIGSTVVAVARPSADLDALVNEAKDTELVAMPADVTDPEAIGAVFDAAADGFGPPMTVIACAGSVDGLGPVVDVDPDRWWSAVTVDLRGTMLTAQAALKAMLPVRRGRILTVYGNLGDRGTPNLSAFAAAKAGVARFTESLAAEVRDHGVIVLCVHPGFVRTPMTEHLAWSDQGRQWIPGFGLRADKSWGDGHTAIELVDEILTGAADDLSGRIVHAGDELSDLARQAARSHDLRRLRIQLRTS